MLTPMSTMYSARSSRSCHECDEGAERATVMAASPSSCGRHGLAGIVRTMPEKACVGNFHYEKVGFTVSHGPGRFLCYHFRIAVSAHAHRTDSKSARRAPPPGRHSWSRAWMELWSGVRARIDTVSTTVHRSLTAVVRGKIGLLPPAAHE